MKKFRLGLLLYLFSTAFSFAQLPGGSNHFQTYGGTWAYAQNNTFRFEGRHQNERVIYELDLKTKAYHYLSDSAEYNQTRYYLNGDTGYVVGSGSTNYYTYDSFATKLPVSQGYSFVNLMKTSQGYLGIIRVSSTYSVMFSSDLQSWTSVASLSNPGSTKFSVVEASGNIYLINQCSHYQVSSDGGASFTLVNTSSSVTDYFLELIAMPDSNTIVARSSTNWLRSNDGGKTWSTSPLSFGYTVLYHDNLDTIYLSSPLAGKNDSFFISLDTLKTIQPYQSGMDPLIVGKKVIKRGDYFVVDNAGELVYSESLFDGWKSLPLFQRGIFCIDIKGSYGLSGGSGGNYSYSHDGGLTFENGVIQNAKDIMACKVVDDSLFLVSDRESDIYKSTDQGLTWTRMYNSTSPLIGRKFVHNADYSVIVLFRTQGGALISTDYGNSWTVLSGQMSILGSITPSGKILVAQEKYENGPNGLEILQTVEELSTTGSRNMLLAFTETDLAQLGLQMYDDNSGYYFAAKRNTGDLYVFSTTDGWATYSQKAVLTGMLPTMMIGYQLNYFTPGKDTIYMHLKHTSSGSSLSNRMIHYSYDGGATWTSEEITSNRFNSPDKMTGMYFFDSRHYISTWSLGRLYLNTQLGGQKTDPGNGGGDTTSLFRPTKQSNLKVYPNPFNNRIEISHLSELMHIELRDAQGRLIQSIPAAGFSMEIETSALPVGMYYLVVSSKEGIETRKMIKTE